MEQIEAITRKYGQKIGSFLLMGIATIYRHASEIAHGTLFGELWFLGFTTPGDYPVTKSDLNSGPRKRATGMLGALSFCVLTLVKVLSDEFGNPENLFTEADEAIRDYISKIRPTGARGTERQ